jgi:heptaprenyl diphosphate synthase
MKKTKYIAYMAMLLTLIAVLSIFESMLPPFPFLPPGVKIGLANTVTMFTLFFIGKKEAFCLTGLKAVFVGITRGVTAGVLSFSGGILSIITLIVLLLVFKSKISYAALSISGAIAHNIGQLIAVCIMFDNIYTMYYLPVLIISGTVMGSITGILLKTVIPALSSPLKNTRTLK